jgi:hypothetical protein
MPWPRSRHPHCPYPFGDHVADRIVDHRGNDAGSETETVGKICRAVELAAAYMNPAFGCFAERNDARVEPVDECAERDEVECSVLPDVETVIH